MQMAVMGGANLAMGLAQGEEFGDALFGAALSAAGTGLMRGITGAAGAGFCWCYRSIVSQIQL